MTRDEMIAAAQAAAGGLDRIRAVRTYRARFDRHWEDGRRVSVRVWRAAGGRIRIDEESAEDRRLAVVSGQATTDDARELLRQARISPRNMLAHASEIVLEGGDHRVGESVYRLVYPAEDAVYEFDATNWSCTRLVDRRGDRIVEYSDYWPVDGIAVPFLERHTVPGGRFEDLYREVRFDDPVSDDLFDG